MFRKTLTAAIAVATISGAALFSTTTASQAGYGYHGGYGYNSGYSYGYGHKHYHHAPKPYYYVSKKVWTHYGYVWKKVKIYY